jgi:hypothetical protein
MLKKTVSKAAGELKPEAYPQGYVEDFNEPRRCLGKGASLGKEAVLAASGRVGEVAAWVGRVRRATFSASC